MEKPAPPHTVSFAQLRGWSLALERAPLFLSVILLFSLPFLTQSDGLNPLYPKQALAQMMVWLIFCAWAAKTAGTGRLVWVRTPALVPLLALLGWVLLSLAFSPYRTLGLGQISHWVIFPLWYLLLTFTCLESWKAENLLLVFLFSALGTCGWAIRQVLGLGQAVGVDPTGGPTGVIAAGLGSPHFLAGYLLLVWPVTLALYLRAGHLLTRIFWSGLLVLTLFCLFLTGSKPGWAGLLVGVLVFGFVYLWKKKRSKSLAAVLVVALLTIALCSFFPPLSQRVRMWTTSMNGPMGFQATVWKGTFEMIKAHPILGTGLGTYEAAFPEYWPVRLVLSQPNLTYEVRHASNWIFEWVAETGVPGLVLLLAVGWFVLAQWWRLFSANAIPRPLGAGIFAAFLGVGVENLFDQNYVLPTTLMPLLFLAAMPVPLSQRFFHLEGFPIRCREKDLAKYRPYLFLAFGGLLVITFHQVRSAFWGQWANLEMKKASKAFEKGNWDEAIAFYGNALNAEPGSFSARYFRGLAYFNRSKEGDAEKALGDFGSVEFFSPDYRQIHFKRYEALRQLNRDNEAKVELKRAAQLDPMLIYLVDDFKKARDLTSAQKYSMAFIVYQNLILDYPTCVPMLVDYANCLALAHDYPSAINLYRRVLELDPDNSKASNNLQKVSEAQKKASHLNPAGLGMGL